MGNWIKSGKGVLVVEAIKAGDKPEFDAGATFVAEMKVESSEKIANDLNEDPNPPGTTVSFVQLFDKYEKTAFGNVKAYLLNLLDENDETLAAAAKANYEMRKQQGVCVQDQTTGAFLWTPEMEFAEVYAAVVDRKQNRCRGMRIRYETIRKPSRGSPGKPSIMLTLPRWAPFKGQTPESITQAKAWLDGQAPKAA